MSKPSYSTESLYQRRQGNGVLPEACRGPQTLKDLHISVIIHLCKEICSPFKTVEETIV